MNKDEIHVKGSVGTAKEPVFIFTGRKHGYLWVGDYADGRETCLFTVQGAALRKLQRLLNDRLGLPDE